MTVKELREYLKDKPDDALLQLTVGMNSLPAMGWTEGDKDGKHVIVLTA